MAFAGRWWLPWVLTIWSVAASGTPSPTPTPDTQAPVWSCPAEITLNPVPNQCYGRLSDVPPVSDNVDPSPNRTFSVGGFEFTPAAQIPYYQFFHGTTSLTLHATDSSGNIGNCTIAIHVDAYVVNQELDVPGIGAPHIDGFRNYVLPLSIDSRYTEATVEWEGNSTCKFDSTDIANSPSFFQYTRSGCDHSIVLRRNVTEMTVESAQFASTGCVFTFNSTAFAENNQVVEYYATVSVGTKQTMSASLGVGERTIHYLQHKITPFVVRVKYATNFSGSTGDIIAVGPTCPAPDPNEDLPDPTLQHPLLADNNYTLRWDIDTRFEGFQVQFDGKDEYLCSYDTRGPSNSMWRATVKDNCTNTWTFTGDLRAITEFPETCGWKREYSNVGFVEYSVIVTVITYQTRELAHEQGLRNTTFTQLKGVQFLLRIRVPTVIFVASANISVSSSKRDVRNFKNMELTQTRDYVPRRTVSFQLDIARIQGEPLFLHSAHVPLGLSAPVLVEQSDCVPSAISCKQVFNVSIDLEVPCPIKVTLSDSVQLLFWGISCRGQATCTDTYALSFTLKSTAYCAEIVTSPLFAVFTVHSNVFLGSTAWPDSSRTTVVDFYDMVFGSIKVSTTLPGVINVTEVTMESLTTYGKDNVPVYVYDNARGVSLESTLVQDTRFPGSESATRFQMPLKYETTVMDWRSTHDQVFSISAQLRVKYFVLEVEKGKEKGAKHKRTAGGHRITLGGLSQGTRQLTSVAVVNARSTYRPTVPAAANEDMVSSQNGLMLLLVLLIVLMLYMCATTIRDELDDRRLAREREAAKAAAAAKVDPPRELSRESPPPVANNDADKDHQPSDTGSVPPLQTEDSGRRLFAAHRSASFDSRASVDTNQSQHAAIAAAAGLLEDADDDAAGIAAAAPVTPVTPRTQGLQSVHLHVLREAQIEPEDLESKESV